MTLLYILFSFINYENLYCIVPAYYSVLGLSVSSQNEAHHHLPFSGKSMKIDHDGIRYLNSTTNDLKASSLASVAVKQVCLFCSKI